VFGGVSLSVAERWRPLISHFSSHPFVWSGRAESAFGRADSFAAKCEMRYIGYRI